VYPNSVLIVPSLCHGIRKELGEEGIRPVISVDSLFHHLPPYFNAEEICVLQPSKKPKRKLICCKFWFIAVNTQMAGIESERASLILQQLPPAESREPLIKKVR